MIPTLRQQASQKIHKAAWNPVLYVDRSILVLNKPPGIASQLHGRGKHPASEDLNGILYGLRKNLSLNGIPYPVHRLDKGTTGSLILARSASLARELSQQFQRRTVDKTYLALVRGGKESFSSKSGEITQPIKYDDGRASLDTSKDSQPSLTHWEWVDSSAIAPISLLRLKLHTGHKHQLRVHTAHSLKTPILGDTLYSAKPLSERITSVSQVPEGRIFLHASDISIFRYRSSGPNKRFRLSIRAPLPRDFLRICTKTGIQVDPVDINGGIFVNDVFVEDGKVPDVDGYWAQ